jgi:hypothetical protein
MDQQRDNLPRSGGNFRLAVAEFTSGQSLKRCTNCHRMEDLTSFISSGHSDLKTCNHCRDRRKEAQKKRSSLHFTDPPEMQSDIAKRSRLNDQQMITTCLSPKAGLEDCYNDIRQAIEEAKTLASGYYVSGVVNFTSSILEADLDKTGQEILLELSRFDGHGYRSV